MPPGVKVLGTQEPRTREMSAREILGTVGKNLTGSLVGRPLDVESVSLSCRSALENMVGAQAGMRGLSVAASSLVGPVSVYQSDHGSVAVSVPDGWEEAVDSALLNRYCGRCGALVTPSFAHGRPECDLRIVAEIMET